MLETNYLACQNIRWLNIFDISSKSFISLSHSSLERVSSYTENQSLNPLNDPSTSKILLLFLVVPLEDP